MTTGKVIVELKYDFEASFTLSQLKKAGIPSVPVFDETEIEVGYLNVQLNELCFYDAFSVHDYYALELRFPDMEHLPHTP